MTREHRDRRTATAATALPQRAPALRLRDVSKVFGPAPSTTVALRDVDLDVAPGEFVTVVGSLRAAARAPCSTSSPGWTRPRPAPSRSTGRVALMFQDATLLPWLTARQNVELALRLRGVPKRERRERAEELLASSASTGGATGARTSSPAACASASRWPAAWRRTRSVVLMDEPLGALDAMTRDHLHDEIERVATRAGPHRAVRHAQHARGHPARRPRGPHGQPPGTHRLRARSTSPGPRVMDSPEVATRAADLTARLKQERRLR